jgi:hypothetical protein
MGYLYILLCSLFSTSLCTQDLKIQYNLLDTLKFDTVRISGYIVTSGNTDYILDYDQMGNAYRADSGLYSSIWFIKNDSTKCNLIGDYFNYYWPNTSIGYSDHLPWSHYALNEIYLFGTSIKSTNRSKYFNDYISKDLNNMVKKILPTLISDKTYSRIFDNNRIFRIFYIDALWLKFKLPYKYLGIGDMDLIPWPLHIERDKNFTVYYLFDYNTFASDVIIKDDYFVLQ